MEIDAKTLGTIIAAALMAAGGGSFITHKSETFGATNVCDGVVQQFLEQVAEQRKDYNAQLIEQRNACDERVRACWQHRTRAPSTPNEG